MAGEYLDEQRNLVRLGVKACTEELEFTASLMRKLSESETTK